MMYMICGPSSVGKSTFIESGEAAKFADLPLDTPTKFPVDFNIEENELYTDFFLHYNILRPCKYIKQFNRGSNIKNRLISNFSKYTLKRSSNSENWNDIKDAWLYKNDISWLNILNTEHAKMAIVLVADKDTLIERTKQRLIIEKSLTSVSNQRKYPALYWLNIYKAIDLEDIYKQWCEELDNHNINYICVNSSTNTYDLIDNSSLSEAL